MMNWKVVVGDLAHVADELRVLHWRLHWLQFEEVHGDCPPEEAAKYDGMFARLQNARAFDEGCLFGCLSDAYRLLNRAWNCRRTSEERVACSTVRDERSRTLFPRTVVFADLWPDAGTIRPTRGSDRLSESRRKVTLTTVRIPIQMASIKLDSLCWLVAKELGPDSPLKIERPARLRPEVGVQPLTEKDLAFRMRRVYSEVNCAWNSRKDKTFVIGRRAFLRRQCFSPDFEECFGG